MIVINKKRLISEILSLCFIFSLVPNVLAQEKDKDVIFFYDFEGYNAKGKPPAGFTDKNGQFWVTTAGSCSSYTDETGNTSLRVSPSITGPAVRLEIGKKLDKGRYLFTSMVKSEFPDNVTDVLYFSDMTQSMRYSVPVKPKQYNGEYAKEKAETGDWAKLNILFDLDKKQVSFWMGDDASAAFSMSLAANFVLEQFWPVLWNNVDLTKGMYFDDMKLVKLPLNVYLDTGKQAHGNIFFNDDEQFIPIKIVNSGTEDEAVTIEYYALTRNGIEVYKETETITVPAESEYEKTVYPKMERFDTATLNVKVTDSKEQIIATSIEFSHVSSGNKVNPRYGICEHLGKGYEINSIGWLLDYEAKAGFSSTRTDFEWARAERAKGTVVPLAPWSDYYTYNKKNGVDVLPVLGLGNQFYDGNGVPYTKEGIEGFTNYALAVAKVAQDAIPDDRHIYEIWNEADLAGSAAFNPTNRSPQEIGTFITTVAKALKENDKNAFVLGGTQANISARKVLVMDSIYNSPEYKRSRKAYMIQSSLEYFVSILVADAFLAKLLTNIGISDALTGIISSFISLACVFQVFSIFLMKKISDTKKTILIFDTVSQIFFLGIYLIPFLPISTSAKTALVILAIIIAYFCKFLIYSILFKWANSYIAPEKRGVFSAIKEMVALFSGIVFTLIIGFTIDRYEALGNISGGYLFTAIIMLLLNLCNFICIARIKNDKIEKSEHCPMRDVLKNTLGNRGFIHVVILTMIWNVALYMTVGFMGTYKTNDLMISVGMVQVINMAASLLRIALSIPIGRFSDKTSFAKGFNLGLIIAAAGFAFNIFAAPGRAWCVVVYTILYNSCFAGTNQNSFNIIYNYVRSDYIVQAMAIKNCIGGLCGFGASLLGSRILSFVQSNGNCMFGYTIYGQQILSAISTVIIIVGVIYTHFVIEKQCIIRQ